MSHSQQNAIAWSSAVKLPEQSSIPAQEVWPYHFLESGLHFDHHAPDIWLECPNDDLTDYLYRFLDYPQKLYNWFGRLALTRHPFFGTVVKWAWCHSKELKAITSDTRFQLDEALMGAVYEAYDENWKPRSWYFKTYDLDDAFKVCNQFIDEEPV